MVVPDLVTWTEQGDALAEPGSWAAPFSEDWAPSVARLGGRYVLYYTAGRAGDGQFCIGRATSDRPIGPFVDREPAALVCPHDGADGVIDPSVFVDVNGAVWLHYKTTGLREVQLWAQPLQPDGLALGGPRTPLLSATLAWENGGVENPEMVFDNGVYWLFYSANWWTDARYRTGLARCDGPAGPCTKTGPFRESDETITGPGGASVVRDASGEAWIVSHGWRGSVRVQYVDALDFTRFGPVLDPARTSPLRQPPFGAFDGAIGVPGGARVTGWAVDPDAPSPIAVHVYVDDAMTPITAARTRADVASVYPASGDVHGYDAVVPAAAGDHTVCTYGINDGPPVHTLLGCRTVSVPFGPPVGSVDLAQGSLGRIDLAGWVIDPDVAASVDLHVYVDGAFARALRADGSRPDVAVAAPSYGAAHGFAGTLVASGGAHTVCIYGINVGLGGNTLIACRDVFVPSGPPVGSLDAVDAGAVSFGSRVGRSIRTPPRRSTSTSTSIAPVCRPGPIVYGPTSSRPSAPMAAHTGSRSTSSPSQACTTCVPMRSIRPRVCRRCSAVAASRSGSAPARTLVPFAVIGAL